MSKNELQFPFVTCSICDKKTLQYFYKDTEYHEVYLRQFLASPCFRPAPIKLHKPAVVREYACAECAEKKRADAAAWHKVSEQEQP